MKRSIWKVPFISPEFLLLKADRDVSSYSRNSFISHFFLKKKISIYMGSHFRGFTIEKPMLGCKTGEFSRTKILGSAISESMEKKRKAKMKAKGKGKGKGKGKK